MLEAFNKFSISFVFCFLLCTELNAKVTLPGLLSDNMVLQQKTDVMLWGKSSLNNNIVVTTGWNKKKYTTQTDNEGAWEIKVTTPSFGGPYSITISDGELLTLNNVLIGDVWVCSGQSNMEMPLAGWGKVNHFKEEISNANFPKIRLLQVEHITNNSKQEDAKIVNNASWQICTPENIAEFSSVAYFFAKEIYIKTGVPIGLLHTSWGGTIIEAWTSGESLKKISEFKDTVVEIENTPENEIKDNYNNKLQNWFDKAFSKDKGFLNGTPIWANPSLDLTGWGSMSLPSFWESSSLKNFDGVVWFKKKINITSSMLGKDLILNIGAIDDSDITYFNGTKIGESTGYNVPRSYKVLADLVKEGENTITIRVFDTGGGGGIYDEASEFTLSTSDQQKISLKGDWKYTIGVNMAELDEMPLPADGPNRPTVLYNAMVNPFVKFKIKGVIWYQGESNAERANQYKTLLPLLINDWRSKWDIGDFPFYFVQLANYMEKDNEPQFISDWALLREAQFQTMSLINTGMAVTIDIGDAKDIHPKNKQDVGKRLALIALHKNYHTKIEYSGPVLTHHLFNNKEAILSFDHAKGLKFKGGKLDGFAIAGEDKKFYWADAVIKDGKVIVTCNEVLKPAAVRYGWGNNPDCNLYNSDDLPASPFRTDSW